MNGRLIEQLWARLSKNRLGRFIAAAIIGGLFSVFAGAKEGPENTSLGIWAAIGAGMGVLAVAILELVDSGRSKPSQRSSTTQSRPPRLPQTGSLAVPPPLPIQGAQNSKPKEPTDDHGAKAFRARVLTALGEIYPHSTSVVASENDANSIQVDGARVDIADLRQRYDASNRTLATLKEITRQKFDPLLKSPQQEAEVSRKGVARDIKTEPPKFEQ